MENVFDANFEKVDSGASLSIPISVSDIKKGVHVVMGEGRPCKIMEITTSKTGKHGHAKANMTGIDIFNGRKYQDACPVSHNKESPNIVRTEWTVMSVDDEGFLSIIDKLGNMRQDLKLPKETEDDEVISNRITNGLENGRTVLVTVLASMGIEKIEDAKEGQEV